MKKIVYYIDRVLQIIKDRGLFSVIKAILSKILGKNEAFIDFMCRKGNYHFRGEGLGFSMIKDSYDYMQKADFGVKYENLLKNLDAESKLTIDLFIKHIQTFYHNNIVHEDYLFTSREKLHQEKSLEFMGKYRVLHPTGYGIFEDGDILNRVGDGDVLDIGASDGLESLMFAKLLGGNRKIYSFEPSSRNFAKLEDNINASNYKDTVLPQKLALGEINGEMEIFGIEGAEVTLINHGGSFTASEIVKISTIDSFISKENIARVGLIKWDIEGSEIESILGAKHTIVRDKPVLIVSIYHNGREFFETKPLLESWNLDYKFRVFQSEPGATWVGVVLICY